MAWRLRVFGGRLLQFLSGWPFRLLRLLLWFLWIRSPRGKHSFFRWLSGILLLIADLIPLSLVYETLMDIFKKYTRLLNDHEREIGYSVFGRGFPLQLVTMDPHSIPVKRSLTSAYVSFHTINYYKELSDSTFIHELVHIWQYERYGSVYISEAIWAQKWGGGYNYGGLEPLLKYSQGKGLRAFNFEQQADIIEDYFRWKSGLPVHWVANVAGVGKVLEKYRDEIIWDKTNSRGLKF
jgi:hypothetical protein